jgi:hypothetical protein
MTKTEEKIDQLKQELAGIEETVMMRPLTLADVMREGSKITTQAYGWGDGENACALHAAAISASARGLI